MMRNQYCCVANWSFVKQEIYSWPDSNLLAEGIFADILYLMNNQIQMS